MEENKQLNYVVNDDGKRELDHDSKVQMQIDYLTANGLYPFKLNSEEMSKLGKQIFKTMSNIKEPRIYINPNDYSNEVFATLLMIVNHLSVEQNKYVSCIKTSVSYLVQQYLSGEYHDLSMEFDQYKVVFVEFDNTEIPHMYNSYSIVSLANGRKKKGLYTFFYYKGRAADLKEQKWMLDLNGDGKAAGENRTLEPMLNYISYTSLVIDKGGK